MKKQFVAVVLLLTCIATLTPPAHADDVIEVTIPYRFVVANTILPAGSYTIARPSATNSSALIIRNNNRAGLGIFVLPTTFQSLVTDKVELRFDQVGNRYLLSEIHTTLGVYRVTKTSPQVRSAQEQPASSPGN
jgi:hypothetical protein